MKRSLKNLLAADALKIDKVAIAGGVAANSKLRTRMQEECDQRKIQLQYPSPILCTDNAAMIGAAAYYEFIHGRYDGMDLNAIPNLKLSNKKSD